MTPRQRRFQRILMTLGEARRGSFVRAVRLARHGAPLSAAGSMLYGGRYNARGAFEALYLADDSDTATREVRLMVKIAGLTTFAPQSPIVLISIDVDLQAVVDLTSPDILAQLSISTRILGKDWNAVLRRNQKPTTHTIGAAAHAAGLEGLIVPSAPHAGAANLVVFPDNLRVGSYVAVHDPNGFPIGTQTRIDGHRNP